MAKSVLSPPTGQGFLDVGRQRDPQSPQATARRPPLRGLFLSESCYKHPSLHFLLPLCVIPEPRSWRLAEEVSPPLSNLKACLCSRTEGKKTKQRKNPTTTAPSWLNNEEQKAPLQSGTKGHSLYCGAPRAEARPNHSPGSQASVTAGATWARGLWMAPEGGKWSLGNPGLWKLLDPWAGTGEAQIHIHPPTGEL